MMLRSQTVCTALRTYKQNSRLLQVHAQLLAQLPFGGKLLTEGGADGQAMHHHLVLPDAHVKRTLLGLLCCHKAAVHILVEPGVVACREVCDHSGKLDGPLNPRPAATGHEADPAGKQLALSRGMQYLTTIQKAHEQCW